MMRTLVVMLALLGAPLTAADEPATTPLTAAEKKFQGTWRDGYTIVIDGREFCADSQPGEWYEGEVVIRTDVEPAQIDFVILVQSGEPNGNVSEGIFRWDGESVLVVSPPPGDPRPKGFGEDEKGPLVRMQLRRDGTSKHPASHCLNE